MGCLNQPEEVTNSSRRTLERSAKDGDSPVGERDGASETDPKYLSPTGLSPPMAALPRVLRLELRLVTSPGLVRRPEMFPITPL